MKTFGKVSCLAAMILAFSISAAHAGDAARGKEISATCAACHGADGKSPVPDFPNIGGQPADYLYRALVDYKIGNRQDPIMVGQVGALSRKDKRDLAAYYASQSGLYLKR